MDLFVQNANNFELELDTFQSCNDAKYLIEMMTLFALLKSPQEMKEFGFLQELEKSPVVSQRELSRRFGVALGVTNACLRKMAGKGWIRIREMDHHKSGYFLTPKGVAEKTRLHLHLVSWRVQQYSALKEMVGKRLEEMERRGIKRVVFYGLSDEMEVAFLKLQGSKMKLVGIMDDEERNGDENCFGHELKDVSQIVGLKPDAILITSLNDGEKKEEQVKKYIDPAKVSIFHLSIP